MAEDPNPKLRAIDEQIERLEVLRRRWVEARDLTEEERPRREITLELLGGALQDLLTRRDRLAESVP